MIRPTGVLAGLFLGVWVAGAGASEVSDVADVAREWRETHEQAIVDEFAALLAIPNVAADTENIRRNAEHIRDLLSPRGFDVTLLDGEGGPPPVFAERSTPGADTTLMIYVHYDGQPVNADDWASPPWTPVLRTDSVENGGEVVPMTAPFDPEHRLFARSAGDDKAPIIALTAALDALDTAGIPLSVNLKLFLDGEEEAGSPHLPAVLSANRERLEADLWLICDGPMHQSRNPQLVYGVRGAWGFDLTTYGPNRPLHSGHYGNWAPNPGMRLVELITSMRAPDGEILIDGVADLVAPPSAEALAAIDAAPDLGPYLTRDLGIGAPETSDRPEVAILRPALNLRGIEFGNVGAQARNSILPSATASLGFRLVPELTPDALKPLVRAHLEAQGYHVIHREPSAVERANHPRLARIDWEQGGYPAYRARLDDPVAQRISAILNEWSDGSLLQTPSMGGSLPLSLIHDEVERPILILPIANHDNNQHGANENLRLKNLWDAIEIYAAVLTGL